MKEYVALAKRNALKKFHTANVPLHDTSLKGMIVDEVEKRKGIFKEPVENPYEDEDVEVTEESA